jgi:hypothetical protein
MPVIYIVYKVTEDEKRKERTTTEDCPYERKTYLILDNDFNPTILDTA